MVNLSQNLKSKKFFPIDFTRKDTTTTTAYKLSVLDGHQNRILNKMLANEYQKRINKNNHCDQ